MSIVDLNWPRYLRHCLYLWLSLMLLSVHISWSLHSDAVHCKTWRADGQALYCNYQSFAVSSKTQTGAVRLSLVVKVCQAGDGTGAESLITQLSDTTPDTISKSSAWIAYQHQQSPRKRNVIADLGHTDTDLSFSRHPQVLGGGAVKAIKACLKVRV